MAFVHNAWYVAALSEELTTDLLSRTILDEPIVFHRQADGCVSALLDVCPHRFAPLSMGTFNNGNLQCPYHGLEFDGAGRCVHNPHGNGARPATLHLRAFPVTERDGLVWIWPGDRAAADASTIPDFSARNNPARRTIGGVARIDCGYRLLVDNLMDLGHAQYVHRAAKSAVFDDVRREVNAHAGVVEALMRYPAGPPTAFVQKFVDSSVTSVDQWIDIRWFPVSAMLNFVAFAPARTPKDQSHNSLGTHILTPETETSCHYFYGASRNFALDDPEIDEAYRGWQRQALMAEDKPMVEAVERLLPVARRYKMRPALLACDEAAARVSKEIEKMLLAEAAQSQASKKIEVHP
jgi:phenylpropionate dioxygenase-like ring-hydroxylating dioxygenase large terminal subunit